MTLIIAHFHDKFANNDSSGDLEDTFIFFAFSSGKKLSPIKYDSIVKYCTECICLKILQCQPTNIKKTFRSINYTRSMIICTYCSMHDVLQEFMLFSLPYFAINKNINFFHGRIYCIHLWHVLK